MDKGSAPKLSSAQSSYLRLLHRDGGFCYLDNSSFRTAGILHDKGMVVVTIETPVKGYVRITEAGKKVAEALQRLLDSTPKMTITEVLGGGRDA